VIVYLFALHQLNNLTKFKFDRSAETNLLQPLKQVELAAVQEEKCQEKENERTQVLASMTPSPGADTDWIKVALEQQSKQSTVTTMMQQVHEQYQTKVATTTGQDTVTKKQKKRKAKPKNAKEIQTNQLPATTLQAISSTPEVMKETAIRSYGCRHGDLSAIKSFVKAEAKYYTRPNKFLEGRSCLDCKLEVTNIEKNAGSQRAVVYYCDEGIKGFDAPDDDPMKSALTCDLILCPKCEAKRRIEYNKADSVHKSRGAKRSRQQRGV
jgi:hypothetical protein